MTTTPRRLNGQRTHLGTCALVIALLCSSSYAHGQKSTERYIPIGQSPGVSGKYTSVGALSDVNARTRVILIADAAGPKTVLLTDTTRIWLDRSKLKQSNLSGRFTDLVKGRKVEVKYQTPATSRLVAEWVKVEITQP
jgi:hypothetical protein